LPVEFLMKENGKMIAMFNEKIEGARS